jgi:copper chaperone CopZ
MCQTCIKKVENALREVEGVVAIKYHWEKKRLEVWGKSLNREKIKKAVESAGYGVES